MVKHVARVGLLALLVFAAAVHVSADITEIEGVLKKLKEHVAERKGSFDRNGRSDVTSCWKGSARTCKVSSKCLTSKCTCCGCPCATLTCWFNLFKSTYNTAERTVKAVKTPAQRAIVAQVFCRVARTNASLTKELIKLYRKAMCPGYTKNIKALAGYQTNYVKWCKFFSG